jgi:hypothetical protein
LLKTRNGKAGFFPLLEATRISVMPHTIAQLNIMALEKILKKHAEDFASGNPAAQVVSRGLGVIGVGLWPVLDHFLFRSAHPEERAREFTELGYTRDISSRILGRHRDPVHVYRCRCLPAILIEETRAPESKEWGKIFDGNAPYVIGVRVADIDEATFHLEKQAVRFLRPGAGKSGEDIRSIAAVPAFQDGKERSVLLLVERHVTGMNYFAPGFWNKA